MYNKRDDVISFCAGGCIINLSLIQEIGGFDSFFTTGYEDAEFGLRAFLSKKKIVFEPKAILFHKGSASINKIANFEKALKIQQDVNYTACKLLPFKVLVWNTFFYVPRTILLLFIHAITFRITYIRIFFIAFKKMLWFDYKIIKLYRKSVNKYNSIDCYRLIRFQKSFIFHDIKRFYRFIIMNERNKFEKYVQ